MKAHPTLRTLAVAFSALIILEQDASYVLAQSKSISSQVVKFESGSTMLLPSASGVPDLGKINFSGLFGSNTPTPTPAPTAQTSVATGAITATATDSSVLTPTASCTDNTCSNASSTSSSQSVSSNTDQSLSSSALSTGAIIGIAIGAACGLVFIAGLIACIVRKRRPKKFNRGRGVTPSMVFTDIGSIDRDPQSYSFNNPRAAFGSNSNPPISSGEVGTISQLPTIVTNRRIATLRQSHRSSNKSRHSKIDILSRAFAQQRQSYTDSNASQITAVARPDLSSNRDSTSQYSAPSPTQYSAPSPTPHSAPSPTPSIRLDHPLQDSSNKHEGHTNAENSKSDAREANATLATPMIPGSNNPFRRTPSLEPPATPHTNVSDQRNDPLLWDRSPLESTFSSDHRASEVSLFTTLSDMPSPGRRPLDEVSNTNPIRNIDNPGNNLRTASPNPPAYSYF